MGDPKVLAAVYGPKAGTKKSENPEKACVEVIWKPKTGQSGEFLHDIGKTEREYEMILKRTLQSVCILTLNPNTTTSVVIQVFNDYGDGAMSVNDYRLCLERGRAATAAMSAFLRRRLQPKLPTDSSKAG